jgi:hypothetical protein
MQHFMKQSAIIGVLILCAISMQAQISGVFSDSYPIPGVKVSVANSQIETFSDIDGKYFLDLPENIEKVNLNFDLVFPGTLSLEIQNFKMSKPKFRLDISVPTYKSLTANEYKNLPENQRKNYKHIFLAQYQPTDVYISNQLDKNYVLIKLDDKEYIIHDYKLDLERNKIIINWFL